MPSSFAPGFNPGVPQTEDVFGHAVVDHPIPTIEAQPRPQPQPQPQPDVAVPKSPPQRKKGRRKHIPPGPAGTWYQWNRKRRRTLSAPQTATEDATAAAAPGGGASIRLLQDPHKGPHDLQEEEDISTRAAWMHMQISLNLCTPYMDASVVTSFEKRREILRRALPPEYGLLWDNDNENGCGETASSQTSSFSSSTSSSPWSNLKFTKLVVLVENIQCHGHCDWTADLKDETGCTVKAWIEEGLVKNNAAAQKLGGLRPNQVWLLEEVSFWVASPKSVLLLVGESNLVEIWTPEGAATHITDAMFLEWMEARVHVANQLYFHNDNNNSDANHSSSRSRMQSHVQEIFLQRREHCDINTQTSPNEWINDGGLSQEEQNGPTQPQLEVMAVRENMQNAEALAVRGISCSETKDNDETTREQDTNEVITIEERESASNQATADEMEHSIPVETTEESPPTFTQVHTKGANIDKSCSSIKRPRKTSKSNVTIDFLSQFAAGSKGGKKRNATVPTVTPIPASKHKDRQVQSGTNLSLPKSPANTGDSIADNGMHAQLKTNDTNPGTNNMWSTTQTDEMTSLLDEDEEEVRSHLPPKHIQTEAEVSQVEPKQAVAEGDQTAQKKTLLPPPSVFQATTFEGVQMDDFLEDEEV